MGLLQAGYMPIYMSSYGTNSAQDVSYQKATRRDSGTSDSIFSWPFRFTRSESKSMSLYGTKARRAAVSDNGLHITQHLINGEEGVGTLQAVILHFLTKARCCYSK